jgi:hypothetical protein
MLPVSPWEIGSVERVARALRWHLDSERFLGYPISIRFDKAANIDIHSGARDGWLDVNADTVDILRPPKKFEWEQLNLYGQFSETKKQLDETETEHERLSAELREAVRERKTGTLNQQKKAAHQLKVDLAQKVKVLGQLMDDFEEATVKMEALIKCPSCGTIVDAKHNFEIRGQGSFQCNCPDCGTRWGTKLCEGGHKFPTMIPGEWQESESQALGWEDKVYGSDLLAVPAKTDRGEWGFVCPVCGVITT